MPINKEEILELRERNSQKQSLDVMSKIVAALQDKSSLETIDQSIKSLQKTLASIEMPKGDSENLLKSFNKEIVQIIFKQIGHSKSLEEAISITKNSFIESNKILTEEIKKKSDGLELAIKELVEIKAKIVSDQNAEWSFDLIRDYLGNITSIKAKRIK
jgi:hypothetical protein